jgi:hypothetical protein
MVTIFFAKIDNLSFRPEWRNLSSLIWNTARDVSTSLDMTRVKDRPGKICNHRRVHPVSTFETGAVKALKKRQNQKYETKLTYSSGSVGNRGGQLRHRASPRSKSGQLPSRRLASRSRLYV